MSADAGGARLVYDGEFDLSFLLDGETVASAGDGSDACWVSQPIAPDMAHGVRVEIGQVLERRSNGTLIAYDGPSASDEQAVSE